MAPLGGQNVTSRVPLTDASGRIRDELWLPSRYAGSYMGPGNPTPPTFQQDPSEGGAPRLRQYPVSSNIMLQPRGEEPGLTPFQQLRTLAASYDIVAICHQTLKDELAALEWDIVPEDKTLRSEADELKTRAKRIRQFIAKPDGEQFLDEWAKMLLGEDLEIGAPVVYKHRTYAGQVGALEIIQGDTIKPLIDYRGKTFGYRQVYMGMALGDWAAQDVIYRPRIRRRSSAYGLSPTELVILNVNLALRRQTFNLAYYTSGNTPEAAIGTPDSWTPADLEAFQTWWDNLLTGEDAERRKFKVIPGKASDIYEFKKYDPETQHELWTLLVTCAIHAVNPEEIGFTHLAKGRSTSGQQAKAQERKGIKPIAQWFERIFTDVIQNDLGEPGLRFVYQLNEEEQDRLQTAQADAANIASRIYTPDYVRDRDGIPSQYAPKDPDPALLAAQNARGDNNQDQQSSSSSPPPAQGKGDNKPAPGQSQNQGQEKGEDADKAAQGDLRKWRDKALKLVKAGRPAACEFESEHIDANTARIIRGELGKARTPDDVRTVFAVSPERLLEKAARSAARKSALEDLAGPALDIMSKAFRAQGERVMSALKGVMSATAAQTQGNPQYTLGVLDIYDSTKEQQAYEAAYTKAFSPSYEAGTRDALSRLEKVGLAGGLRKLSRFAGLAKSQASEADRVTRKLLDAEIRDGIAAGYTLEQIAYGVEADGYAGVAGLFEDWSKSRAYTVARTEVADAWNVAALSEYEAASVSQVSVFDGVGDEVCASADGQVWPVEVALANPLGHPNCQRDFDPVS